MAVELGDLARDKVTGFEGVVICKYKFLHGCERVLIQPKKLHEGKPVDSVSFDIPQVELVEKAQHETTGDTGGPEANPTGRADPGRGRP